MNKTRFVISCLALIAACAASASGRPPDVPGVVAEFCTKRLNDDIAGVGQPFNATDVREEGLPTRRIVGYFVTSSTSFLWYEHGGRGHHQHLVSFNSAMPEEVKASYVFVSTKHSEIGSLIKDTEFLRQHVSESGEL